MKLGTFLLSILGVAALLAGLFGLTWMGIEWRGFFGPKRAEVERTIFEQTPSYVFGKQQHITRLRLDWETAETDTKKAALRRVILYEASTVDIGLLDQSTRSFIQGLQ